ncbi:matrix metalloproteinase-18-like [Pituophis catenifer annectens]|uniref:matrix metalloproteinase-18-like n=1 Tax=Pituophis catenifer annectens TaxID=94852 RepID=UPI0039956615
MQEFFHLAVTGKMDKDTLNVMKQPRCGVSDVSEGQKAPIRIWNKKVLTYRINNYTPDLPRRTIEAAIARAFQVWSDVTPLTFQKVFIPADIEIAFVHGEHGDYSPFDRQGGVLAHAYYPGVGIGGDTHFDEAEKWSAYNREVNLFLVAAHEFGHALGLSHSNVVGSLMYPTYSYTNPQIFRLPSNDRRRIQRLYVSSEGYKGCVVVRQQPAELAAESDSDEAEEEHGPVLEAGEGPDEGSASEAEIGPEPLGIDVQTPEPPEADSREAEEQEEPVPSARKQKLTKETPQRSDLGQ